MTLRPDDVRTKRFTPVRLREGYDMGEVDAFLDEVETELKRLLAENEELRAGGGAGTPGESQPRAARRAIPQARRPSDGSPSKEPAPAESGSSPTSASEAATAAARLLEIATRNADELVSEAKKQAEQARAAAKAETERLQSQAKAAAEKLAEETAGRRSELMTELLGERDALTEKLAELRAFEREGRSRLKAYFESQLAALEGEVRGDSAASEPSSTAAAPSRLTALLAEAE